METTNFSEQPQVSEPAKRPEFLGVLCILSFIWSGFVLLCLLFCLLFSSVLFELMENMLAGANGMPTLDEGQQQAVQSIMNLGKGAFAAIIAISMIAYMTSLLGVFKMWRMQKWGFYIYVVVNGIGVIFNLLSGSFFMMMISVAFIIMYAVNLKHMK